ncbi:uncharacterized protein V1510DRAFT_421251 [Dipodascopsis tothii]|uniref:uncharacterized protein n=1 Tax=Dipodascopsis tothii TaxID=44089 RepID=UPI0034CEE5C1
MLITTEKLIKASPAKVRQALLDFGKHPDWNPFFKSIAVSSAVDVADSADYAAASVPAPGATLQITIAPVNRGEQVIKPTVLVNTAELFKWRGILLVGFLFAGEHAFEFKAEAGPGGEEYTRFVHSENFSGVLVPLLGGILADTKASFILLNDALADYVEA